MCLHETYSSEVDKNMWYVICLEYSERRCPLITIACQVREDAVEWGLSGFID